MLAPSGKIERGDGIVCLIGVSGARLTSLERTTATRKGRSEVAARAQAPLAPGESPSGSGGAFFLVRTLPPELRVGHRISIFDSLSLPNAGLHRWPCRGEGRWLDTQSGGSRVAAARREGRTQLD